MNTKEHVLNAALLSIGLGYLLEPDGGVALFYTTLAVGVPVVLGSVVPDIDSAFGEHRKTMHNLAFLGVFVWYPTYFDNLRYVWIGVLTHFALDLLGSKRGLALLYPLDQEFGSSIGVSSHSSHTTLVTLLVTAFELAVAKLLLHGDLLAEAGNAFGV